MGTDLWTLGCIIFKMNTGKVPFSGMANHVIWPKIMNRQIEWPKDRKISPDLKDLIDRLIQLEEIDRIGHPDVGNGIQELMDHPFFKGIEWSAKALAGHKLRDKLQKSSLKIAKKGVAQNRYTIDDGKPVLTGVMLKKNRFFMKQARNFELYPTGELKYFKGM